MAELFDVVAVNVITGKVRLLSCGKDRRNAETIVAMAVMRRGVDVEFFSEVPDGAYRDGDQWAGDKRRERR